MRATFTLNALACLAAVLVLGAVPSVTGDGPVTALLVAGGAFLTAGLIELARVALRATD